MLKEAIATGDTLQAAQDAAAQKLAALSYLAQYVQYETLKMPVKKTLGLFGGSPAEVRAFLDVTPAQIAAGYLKEIFAGMGLTDVQVRIEEEEGGAMLCVTGDDIGFVIGHRGDTLDSLQYLAGLVANHAEGSYYRITLDIGSYREKRKETLETLGKKMAAKAVKMGRNFSLEPMNPYERRIIHTAVQEVEGAKSWSEGEDMMRHVVIGPEAGERVNRFDNRSRYNGPRRPAPQGSRPAGNRPPRAPQNRTEAAPAKPAAPAPVQQPQVGFRIAQPQRPNRDMGDKPMTTRPDYSARPKQNRSDDNSLPLYGRIK